MKTAKLEESFEKELGNRLKKALYKSRMKGTELAEKTGISKARISRMMNGSNNNMTLATVLTLSAALNVSPSWLAFGELDKNEDNDKIA